MSSYTTIQQHEPLKVPAEWGSNGAFFANQLEQIFDDIYRRFGRLRLADMGKEFRREYKDALGNITTLQQNASSISSRVEDVEGNYSSLKETVKSLSTTVKSISGSISTLEQSEESFKATFSHLGADGYTAIGIITLGINGITVTHSSIHTSSVLGADGFKIYNSDGQLIGGTYVPRGQSEVKAGFTALMNPAFENYSAQVNNWSTTNANYHGLLLYQQDAVKAGLVIDSSGVSHLLDDSGNMETIAKILEVVKAFDGYEPSDFAPAPVTPGGGT